MASHSRSGLENGALKAGDIVSTTLKCVGSRTFSGGHPRGPLWGRSLSLPALAFGGKKNLIPLRWDISCSTQRTDMLEKNRFYTLISEL